MPVAIVGIGTVLSPADYDLAADIGAAMPAGNLPTIDALSGPSPSVHFYPTGCICETSVVQWLAPKIASVGGS